MLAHLRTPSRREGGFTLVELLVVIAVLAVLTAIAVPTFLNQRAKAHDAAVRTDVRAVASEVAAAVTSDPAVLDVAPTSWTPITGVSLPLPTGPVTLRVTEGSTVEIKRLSGDRWCLRGSSAQSSTTGSPTSSGGTFFHYRSTGGMVVGDAQTSSAAGC